MKFVEAVCAYVRKLYHDGLAAFEALDGFGLERVEGEFEDFGRRRRCRRGGRARRRSNIALRVRHVVQAGQKLFAKGERRIVISLVPFLRKQSVSRRVLCRPPLRGSRKSVHEPWECWEFRKEELQKQKHFFWDGGAVRETLQSNFLFSDWVNAMWTVVTWLSFRNQNAPFFSSSHTRVF